MGTKKEAIVKRVKLAWDAKTKTLGLYTPKRFIVMASTAQVSSRLRRANKRFMNVAVVETDEQALPAMISPRARHLIRVVKHYGLLPPPQRDRVRAPSTTPWLPLSPWLMN